MIDLDAIAPSATAIFSNYLEPLEAKCNLKSFNPNVTFDQTIQQLNTSLDWSCGLFRATATKDNLLSIK